MEIKQFDSNRRITIPADVLDAAAINPGDWANISFDKNTQRIVLQLMTFTPRSNVEAAPEVKQEAKPEAKQSK